jgi:pyridoxine 5-phosphate synthase
MSVPQRLGVNVDHIATLRNARGGAHPDPVRGALVAMQAGADGITAHLREDRRHIRDLDVRRLKDEVPLPLNLEMAVTEEMLGIALDVAPHAACLVPEKRTEVTTEGGLDAARTPGLAEGVSRLAGAGIRVSLFVDPDPVQVEAARRAGAPVIELHTGPYCDAEGSAREAELSRLQRAAALAGELGLECHAGHGLTFANVSEVAAIPNVVELNIGHFLVGEAVMTGLGPAVAEMKRLMQEARAA